MQVQWTQILAFIPVVFLIITLATSVIETWKAAILATLIAIGLSVSVFPLSITESLTAVLEGALLGLWPILMIIISAIFTYKVMVHTRSMDRINSLLSAVSTDRRVQVLVLAWGFGGFLEAISGYGTSVAIPAGILIGLGFSPVFAATVCLIANSAPTAYGAVGVAVTTLADVTGLDLSALNITISQQLSPFVLVLPFVLVMITAGGFKGMKGAWGITIVSSLSFLLPLLLAARFLTEQLPTLLGSICCMIATVLWARRFHKGSPMPKMGRETVLAFLPYILIFLFILVTGPLVPPVNTFLGRVKTVVQVYSGIGAGNLTFKWLLAPGTLIFIAAIIGGLFQGASVKTLFLLLAQTLRQMWKSAVTVLSIVALAKVMGYSGMTAGIAAITIQMTGKLYPFFSPMIGMLGTFLTGSDTSSNILFGELQKEAAIRLGADPVWLASANTAGATAGKMISPQSIMVAATSVGLDKDTGLLFRKTVIWGIPYCLLLGVLVMVF